MPPEVAPDPVVPEVLGLLLPELQAVSVMAPARRPTMTEDLSLIASPSRGEHICPASGWCIAGKLTSLSVTIQGVEDGDLKVSSVRGCHNGQEGC